MSTAAAVLAPKKSAHTQLRLLRAGEVPLTAARRSMAYVAAIFLGREPGNSEFADVYPIARAGSLDVRVKNLSTLVIGVTDCLLRVG